MLHYIHMQHTVLDNDEDEEQLFFIAAAFLASDLRGEYELEISCTEIAKGGFVFSVLSNVISFFSEVFDNVASLGAGGSSKVLESNQGGTYLCQNNFALYNEVFSWRVLLGCNVQ